MSNEEIIDSVNVAECEFYDDLECNAYRQEYWEPQDNTKDFCKEHPDCYFKQLQRLKDKSEKIDHRFKQTKKANKKYKIDIKELKESNDSYDEDVRALLEDKEKLQAENEKLKRRNKLYKKIIKENIEKANNNFMILTACIQGNLSIDEVKEYAKLNAKNDELKRKLKDLINYYELREGGMLEDIQYWKNKAQEFYKELEEYKKSKQASYEAMQAEWNNAVNELRNVKAENEKLKAENDELKMKNNELLTRLSEKYGEHRGCLII